METVRVGGSILSNMVWHTNSSQKSILFNPNVPNPFPNDNLFLYSFKIKEFADDNFKFDENGRKFSKRVENTVGK